MIIKNTGKVTESAANAFTDKRSQEQDRWRDLDAELKSLQASWGRVGPVPGAEGRRLAERFRRACDSYQSTRRAASS